VVKDERQTGFTLMELLFTIAVAAIILSVGVPGFMSFIDNNRAVTHTNDLVTALNLGRSEATRRGSTVIVCSSVGGTGCDGDEDWSTGWVVCTEAAGACGQLLRSWPERSGGAGVVVEQNDLSQFRFLARGSVAGTAPLFEVRLEKCTGDQGRDVAVNGAGRISVSRMSCS
jgi:type IV fimbrial biogenesis protein FimT